MQPDQPPVHFLNLEYFFRILYDLLHGSSVSSGSVSGNVSGNVSTSFGFSSLLATLSNLWLLVTILAYLFSLAAIGVLIYATLRIYQVRKEEEPRYATVGEHDAHIAVEHSRWNYIQQLIESGQESDWRNAIIESDIMLDEMLTRLGYMGDSVGEKLKSVNPNHFKTLNNAWDAHRVRNDIAHSGSQFQLSEHLAHRTIANYYVVFQEHGEV